MDPTDNRPHVDDVRRALKLLLRQTLSRNDDKMEIVLRLLTTHPTWGTRLGDVQGARVRLSRANQSLQLQLRTQRSWFTVSWRQCAPPRRPRSAAAPANNVHRQLLAAMRQAVRRETQAWRRLHNNLTHCATCMATTRLQVDHAQVPFSVVSAAFLAGEGDVFPTSFDYTRSCIPTFQRSDSSFAKRWRAYHAHTVNGSYQLLCQSCNASKSNRSIS
jgi:hypothetical protein